MLKRILSAVMVCLIAAGIVLIPALSAGAADTLSYTAEEIEVYSFDEDDSPNTRTCLFRSDLPEVPFMSVLDYLHEIYTSEIEVTDEGDEVRTYAHDDATMTVDAKADRITFDIYEEFLGNGYKIFYKESECDYIDDADMYTYIDTPQGVEIDLSPYKLDAVYYEGEIYLPCCTLNDLFADIGGAARYKDHRISYISSFDMLFKGGGAGFYTETRTQAMADFSYNELCFVMDYCYGMPSMALLADSIRENGFDQTLQTYNGATARIRELLRSERTENFSAGIVLLDYYLDDGGHTNMSIGLTHAKEKYEYDNPFVTAEKIFGDSEMEEQERIFTYQEQNDQYVIDLSDISDQKEKAYAKMETIKEWESARLCRYHNLYIFDFDEFKNEVIEPFKWSLDYAQEHDGKYFVVDLTTNLGGLEMVACYMMTLLYGKADIYEQCAISENRDHLNPTVDKNLDGEFDEKDDALKYSFRCAVLCSHTSFSCANLMPCAAADMGELVMGVTSGGGCCNISPHFYPDGSIYSIAGQYISVHPDGRDVDDGAAVSYILPGPEKGYRGFYDMDRIRQNIDDFYDYPVTHGEDQKRYTDYSFLWRLIPIAAVSVIVLLNIAAAVIIVIAVRRKKHKNTDKEKPV